MGQVSARFAIVDLLNGMIIYDHLKARGVALNT